MATRSNVGSQSRPPVFVDEAERRGIIPACRGEDIGLFFPDHKGPKMRAVWRARQICAGCPLLKPCREYALSMPVDHLYGVWGGLSRDDRIEIKARS